MPTGGPLRSCQATSHDSSFVTSSSCTDANPPALAGRYVFGDFGSGRIFAIPENSAAGVAPEELLDTTHGIVTFATGEDGELYFADYFVGTIHKIEAAP